jgi:DNA-binding MarR family transcriptional regulator
MEVKISKERRRVTVAIKDSLRELNIRLSLLNQTVGGRLELREIDLDCLELINRLGPLTPSALAKEAGLHPATLTGILDRLERGGWLSRDRDPADRRAVLLTPKRDRGAEIFGLYKGMNTAMDGIMGNYHETELRAIADFLQRCAVAGRQAAEHLRDSV